MNGNSSYIFKTSRFQLKLANDMNRTKNTIFSTEYFHVDGKECRCTGYTTITAGVFHPVLRKMIPLAVMETEGKGADNVILFWKTFNKALKECLEDDNLYFHPYGIITDEAGRFWKAAVYCFEE